MPVARLRAPTHYLIVDLDDPGEAEYWQLVLDAPRVRIEAAIAAVGRDANEVRRHIESEQTQALTVAGGADGVASPSSPFQIR